MLRACINGVFVLGLDAENVKRLKEGKPILIALAELGGTDDVAIMYGDTIEDMKRALEESMGRPLPPETTLEKLRNPQ